MWSILVITSSIFQTAVAIFLLNGVRTGSDIDKLLRAMLLILLVHLSVKFVLLAVLKDQFLYATAPSGFSLAYGPLLLIIARSVSGRTMRSRTVLFHFIPFFLLSLVYLSMIGAGTLGILRRSVIASYAAGYQWLLIPSLFGYPIFVKWMLRKDESEEGQLTRQMANVLVVGVAAALSVASLRRIVDGISGFDLRLLPYLCYSAIPILILRYRLRKAEEKRTEGVVPVTVGLPAGAGGESTDRAVGVYSPVARATEKRYEKSGIDAAKLDEYEAALAAFMKKSRIYLDADLSLEGLATRMKMPKHHLTQLLNDRVMKNFYTFINEYRIAEAVAQIREHVEEVNILSLAFDCGFNSRSSFNNYFKKITGETPSAFRKRQLGESGLPDPSGFIPGTSPSIS
jgi:AraC-like DNA-binding protein